MRIDPTEYRRIKELFLEAADLPPEARKSFLDERCENASERERLEGMLEQDTPEFETKSDEFAKPLAHIDDKIGPYRILDHLGEGGFCVVYLAEQTVPLRRQVALKLIKPGLDTRSVIARFEVERQALAMMSHPGIARIYDSGVTPQGRPYFAMEYVPGIPITDYCDRQRLTIEERLRLFVEVCDAVQHAHHKAIIHRDIKPSNVLVAKVDGAPVLKVIDFGIAKSLAQKLTDLTLHTMQGQFIGTPEYMSPEQASGSGLDVDTRTDVYALGVLLYELLVGRVPVDSALLRGSGIRELQNFIGAYEPRRPSSRLRELDDETATRNAASRKSDPLALANRVRGDLDWITLKAIAKEPERRYATPSELARDIHRYFENDNVSATPPSLGYRVKKLWKRNRGLLSSAALVFVALASGVVVSSALYWESEKTNALLEDALVRSEGLRLVAASAAAVATDPDTGLLLALEGAQRYRGRESSSAVLSALGHFVPHRTVVGHSRWVRSCDFDSSGTRFLTASLDGTASVWNASSGELIRVLRFHEKPVEFARFSPNGKQIAIAARDGSVSIVKDSGELVRKLSGFAGHVIWVDWLDDDRVVGVSSWFVKAFRVSTGDALASHRTAGKGHLAAAARNSQGDLVVAGDSVGGVQVFGLEDSTIRTHFEGRTEIRTIEFSPDGKRVLVANLRRAYVRDLATKEIVLRLERIKRHVLGARYSPDGRWIVSVSDDWRPLLWNAETGELHRAFEGHSSSVICAAFSPDGSRLVTGSIDNTARIWNVLTGELESTLRAHSRKVTHVEFSRDGTRVGTASMDTTAGIWHVGSRAIPRFEHTDRIETIDVSRDDSRVVSASWNAEAVIWDIANRRRLVTLRGHRQGVSSARFSADGSRILTRSVHGRTVRIWNAVTGDELRQWKQDGDTLTASLSPDGLRIVIADRSAAESRLYDTSSGELLRSFPIEGKVVWQSGFTPDGGAVYATSDRGVYVWDAQSGAETCVLRDHDGYVLVRGLHGASRRMLTIGHDGFARLWDYRTGAKLAEFPHERQLNEACLSDDGTRALTTAHEDVARVWDTQSGELLLTLSGHEARLCSLSFSGDGRRILTAAFDATARVWDAETGEELLAYRGHSSRLQRDARFLHGGKWAITASFDNTIHIWPVEPVEVAESLRPRELYPLERKRFSVPDGAIPSPRAVLENHTERSRQE